MAGFWLFNTNETYRPETRDYMFERCCICAQYSAKDHVDLVSKSETVFIYENGTGIIAYGVANGEVVLSDYEGYANERHEMLLQPFHELETPITTFEISDLSKKLDGVGIYYARTASPLRPHTGKKLLQMAKQRTRKGT